MASKKGSELKDIMAGIEASVGNVGAKKKPRLMLGNDVVTGDIVSFGVPPIDAASNVGGHPKGTIVELFGPEGSGKSWVAYKMIAAYQSAGMYAMLLDIEHAFWRDWIVKAGVNLDRLIVGQDFDSGENALRYAKEGAESKKIGVIVIDSIAALLPQAEADANLDKNARVGAHAAMMSRCLRQLQVTTGATDTTLVCINQTRNKIGVMFGSPEDTPGGKALKFYAGIRIGLQHLGREKGKVDGEERIVGIRTKVKFIKNKIGQPFGEDEIVIYQADDINTPMVQLVNLAIRLKVVPGRKSFYEDDPDKKTFYWKGDDGEIEDTGCKYASDLSEWFEANEMVPKVVGMVVEKAKAKGIEVPAEVVALAAPAAEADAKEDAPKEAEPQA
jgi:recombination protein RecA